MDIWGKHDPGTATLWSVGGTRRVCRVAVDEDGGDKAPSEAESNVDKRPCASDDAHEVACAEEAAAPREVSAAMMGAFQLGAVAGPAAQAAGSRAMGRQATMHIDY